MKSTKKTTWWMVVSAFVVGFVFAFAVSHLHAESAGKEKGYEMEDVGIVKSGYYQSLEDVARDFEISVSGFKECLADRRTVVTARIVPGRYYEIVRCTLTKKGYYCTKIADSVPTPNFVYWYVTCFGTEANIEKR